VRYSFSSRCTSPAVGGRVCAHPAPARRTISRRPPAIPSPCRRRRTSDNRHDKRSASRAPPTPPPPPTRQAVSVCSAVSQAASQPSRAAEGGALRFLRLLRQSVAGRLSRKSAGNSSVAGEFRPIPSMPVVLRAHRRGSPRAWPGPSTAHGTMSSAIDLRLHRPPRRRPRDAINGSSGGGERKHQLRSRRAASGRRRPAPGPGARRPRSCRRRSRDVTCGGAASASSSCAGSCWNPCGGRNQGVAECARLGSHRGSRARFARSRPARSRAPASIAREKRRRRAAAAAGRRLSCVVSLDIDGDPALVRASSDRPDREGAGVCEESADGRRRRPDAAAGPRRSPVPTPAAGRQVAHSRGGRET